MYHAQLGATISPKQVTRINQHIAALVQKQAAITAKLGQTNLTQSQATKLNAQSAETVREIKKLNARLPVVSTSGGSGSGASSSSDSGSGSGSSDSGNSTTNQSGSGAGSGSTWGQAGDTSATQTSDGSGTSGAGGTATATVTSGTDLTTLLSNPWVLAGIGALLVLMSRKKSNG
jgi:hypothetical protein